MGLGSDSSSGCVKREDFEYLVDADREYAVFLR